MRTRAVTRESFVPWALGALSRRCPRDVTVGCLPVSCLRGYSGPPGPCLFTSASRSSRLRFADEDPTSEKPAGPGACATAGRQGDANSGSRRPDRPEHPAWIFSTSLGSSFLWKFSAHLARNTLQYDATSIEGGLIARSQSLSGITIVVTEIARRPGHGHAREPIRQPDDLPATRPASPPGAALQQTCARNDEAFRLDAHLRSAISAPVSKYLSYNVYDIILRVALGSEGPGSGYNDAKPPEGRPAAGAHHCADSALRTPWKRASVRRAR